MLPMLLSQRVCYCCCAIASTATSTPSLHMLLLLLLLWQACCHRIFVTAFCCRCCHRSGRDVTAAPSPCLHLLHPAPAMAAPVTSTPSPHMLLMLLSLRRACCCHFFVTAFYCRCFRRRMLLLLCYRNLCCQCPCSRCTLHLPRPYLPRPHQPSPHLLLLLLLHPLLLPMFPPTWVCCPCRPRCHPHAAIRSCSTIFSSYPHPPSPTFHHLTPSLIVECAHLWCSALTE